MNRSRDVKWPQNGVDTAGSLCYNPADRSRNEQLNPGNDFAPATFRWEQFRGVPQWLGSTIGPGLEDEDIAARNQDDDAEDDDEDDEDLDDDE